jgi:hypothetical protein
MLDTTRFEDFEGTEVQVEEACIRERGANGTLNPNQQQTRNEKDHCSPGSMLNSGLIDEVRLMVNPLIVGETTALCKDVKKR